jgi:hypothetical protein
LADFWRISFGGYSAKEKQSQNNHLDLAVADWRENSAKEENESDQWFAGIWRFG